MPTSEQPGQNHTPRIVVSKDGPYLVYGHVLLVRKMQLVSEYGEPLTWRTVGAIETRDMYRLCRCGGSHNKPFCDDTHREVAFNSVETVDTAPTATRRVTYGGSTGIVVRRDYLICSEAGFCANRLADIEELTAQTDEPQTRALVMAMIEHCPSGSLVYSIHEGEPDVEPDYPVQIAVTTEYTVEGDVAGPLWVTGRIPIYLSDGRMLEARPRVTLCRCGHSRIMPLCDGAHRELHIREE